MKTNIKTQALKLAHSIKQAYSSFSSALRVAYSVLKSEITKRQVLRGLCNAYHLCDKLGLTKQSNAIFKAFIIMLDLPKLPALRS